MKKPNHSAKQKESPWGISFMAFALLLVGVRMTYRGLTSHEMIAGGHRSGPATPGQALFMGIILLGGSIYVGNHAIKRIKQNRK